jgi:hypothetical protein
MPFSIGTGGMRYLIIGIMALSALTGSALAHTPAGVEVSYDGMSGELGVAITHQVEDPVTHYVKQVTVRQGSTVLIAQTYTSQPNKKAFTYRYYLPPAERGGRGDQGRCRMQYRWRPFRDPLHGWDNGSGGPRCRDSLYHQGARLYFYCPPCSRFCGNACNAMILLQGSNPFIRHVFNYHAQ